MPLSDDPAKRARQLANLRPATPAPIGNRRRLTHGGRSELLLRDVEAEVAELRDAFADAAPVRDLDGSAPAADTAALEVAARALKRYRHLSGWLDLHGRLDDRGGVRPAAELELKAERQLTAALDSLGMTPRSRVALGLDLARTRASLDEEMAAGREVWQRAERRLEAIDGDSTGPDDDGGGEAA